MIRSVDAYATNFEEYSNPELYGMDLSAGVLTPTQCEISETAGGDYNLSMTHPIDSAGKWRLIQPMSMICAPIPVTETPPITPDTSGLIGVGDEVWAVNANNTSLYGRRSAYKAWISGEGYYPGNRVSHHGHNWEATGITLAEPGTPNAAWKDLGSLQYTIRIMTAGTTLVVTSQDSSWLNVVLLDGTRGYVSISKADYQYTIEEGSAILDDIPARVLTHQLFRVTDVSIDGKSMTVQVNAQHASYDWSMALVGKITFKDTPLPSAIAALRTATLPNGVSSAPAIYAEATENTITAACTRKSVTSVILDPSTGFVNQARARLIRDGKDFFLLADTNTDHGYTIRYGVNLRGVTWQRNYSKLVTRVMPIAQDAHGDEYLLPEVYVDSPHRDEYPVDAYEALNVDAKIGDSGQTEEDVQAKMREEAGKVFAEEKADLPVTTLTVDFLMLGDTEEYAQYKGLERLNLYDTVEIIHSDIGLRTSAQVKSYKWDALHKRYTQITLGDAFEAPTHTVYGYSVADGAPGVEKLTPEAIEAIRNG